MGNSDREIFGPYWNGEKMIHADPLAVHRRLTHHLGGNPNEVLKNLRAQAEPVRFEAMERLLAASVQAFGLKPFDPADGSGCTEKDCLALVRRYIDWLDKKKERPASSPTLSEPTTSSPGRSTTRPTAGCGCI